MQISPLNHPAIYLHGDYPGVGSVPCHFKIGRGQKAFSSSCVMEDIVPDDPTVRESWRWTETSRKQQVQNRNEKK